MTTFMSSQHKNKKFKKIKRCRRGKNLAFSGKYNMDLLSTCQLWFGFSYSMLRHGAWKQTPRASAYKYWTASLTHSGLQSSAKNTHKSRSWKWSFWRKDEIFGVSVGRYCHGGFQCSLPGYCTCFLYIIAIWY